MWLATHEAMRSDVAIKFPTTLDLDDAVARQFEAEVKSHVEFSNRHPNIVSILDVGRLGSRPYVVMQYLANGCLHSNIFGRCDMAKLSKLFDSSRWLSGIAGALDYLHEQNLVHRDVKPANVLLDESMSAYLADFGIATSSNGGSGEATTMIMGSLPYIAPELLFEPTYSPKSDQYALAVTLYEFLTLKRPYEATNAQDLTEQQREDSIVLPSAYLAGLPGSVDSAVLRGLSREPSDRFERCRDLVAAIEPQWDVICALLMLRTSTTKMRTKTNRPLPKSSTVQESAAATASRSKPKIKLSRLIRQRKDD